MFIKRKVYKMNTQIFGIATKNYSTLQFRNSSKIRKKCIKLVWTEIFNKLHKRLIKLHLNKAYIVKIYSCKQSELYSNVVLLIFYAFLLMIIFLVEYFKFVYEIKSMRQMVTDGERKRKQAYVKKRPKIWQFMRLRTLSKGRSLKTGLVSMRYYNKTGQINK